MFDNLRSENDFEIISNIKSLGLDMIKEAGSGHPGIVLGAAPILYSLYAYHLNINSEDPTWFNRDRFVMSAGHGSALLYATLFMSGYSLTIDDLKAFRRIDSKTPGHPEVHVTPGVDASTGPLGQGIATAVGMALGEKILKERYRIDNNSSLIDYDVYCLVGDGCLMEGISYEAASLAGTLKLDNLIVLYDSNGISLDGPTSNTFTENIKGRFTSMNWEVLYVKDGTNVMEINRAINRAKQIKKPVLIEIKTVIGAGSVLEATNNVHGKVLANDDIAQLKNKLGVPQDAFYYNPDMQQVMRSMINKRVDKKYKKSNQFYNNYVNNICQGDKTVAKYMFNNKFEYDLLNVDFRPSEHAKEATRDTNNEFIKYLSHNIKTFVGGSADLASTTKTYISEMHDITSNSFEGNNIWFGVREHAMGAILNGMALVNLKPYGSTFLSFADYLKPAMRLASLMELPVTYIFSHDSIYVGPDGPTHQPIEQLAMLRSIPNMKVYRPADAKELQGCWQVILNSNNNPSSLILSRNEVSLHPNTNIKLTTLGGYVYYKEQEKLDTVIVASGTELMYARNIGYELTVSGYKNFRIVSMPCIERYLENIDEYKKSVIPDGVKVIVIEAGSSFGWHRIIDNKIYYLTLDKFGKSGSVSEVLDYMDFSYDKVKERVINIINS